MTRLYTPVKPYVVWVTYPNGSRQYAYMCDMPCILPGHKFIINGAVTTVERITSSAEAGGIRSALKWVPDCVSVPKHDRIAAIRVRLTEIERQERLITAWSKLKSPEAKRLVKELKELLK